MSDSPPPRRDCVVLACILVPVAVLYATTASPYVLGEDNGEFCALYAAGGVAHPSGYPLYTLLLRTFSWLPVATPARGAALVTAGIGLAAVAAAYAACRAWGAGWAASATACILYATAPLAWDLSTKAEVFALNAALALTIVLVAAPFGPFRGPSRAGLLGLTVGLGMSNHHSIVLLAPLIGWGALEAARESSRAARTSPQPARTSPQPTWTSPPRMSSEPARTSPSTGRAAVLLFVGCIVGLLPYGSLPIAARSAGWVWGDVTTAGGLLAHVLRRDFGTTQLAVRNAHPSIAANLGALGRTLLVDLRGVGCVVGLGVLALGVARAVRRTPDDRRWRAVAALATSFVLAGPGFAALMNVELSPEGTAIVRRFHLLPMLLLVVPIALGADALIRRARAPLQAAVAATTLMAGSLLGLGAVSAGHGPMLESYLVDTLRTAPRNAVLLGSGDARVFGALYEQLGRGLRRDVVFVSPILLHYDWYRRRVGAALSLSLPPPTHGSVDTVTLATQILGTGRRLFLTDVFGNAILERFTTYPIGTLIEVLPRGAPLPSPGALERQNLDLFATYHVDRAALDVERPWSRGVRDAYARPWRALADAFASLGDRDAAARNAERATTLVVATTAPAAASR